MQSNYAQAKEILRKQIRDQFGKPLHSIKSFEELSENTKLSAQTLRRFFGKIDKEKEIGFSSLSILSRFVGHQDWNCYLNNFENSTESEIKDRFFIDSMEVFFRSGNAYQVDYLQKTITTDTLNEYAKTIYKSKENTQYFFKLYKYNNWATDYIFAWLPNYNYFGQEWFQKILVESIQLTPAPPVKLALSNFLILGYFLTKGNSKYLPDFGVLAQNYTKYKREFSYMPYHEMRYHTILLIKAKESNDMAEFRNVLNYYLQNLLEAGLTKAHYHEMIVFLCNTLLWLQEYKLAYELLKPLKRFAKNFSVSYSNEQPMHYLGLNKFFVKTTFELAWITNQQKTDCFDYNGESITDPSGLLYNDYISVMSLATCVISERTILKKKIIFDDLKKLVLKTGYARIYDILEDNDAMYQSYS